MAVTRIAVKCFSVVSTETETVGNLQSIPDTYAGEHSLCEYSGNIQIRFPSGSPESLFLVPGNVFIMTFSLP